VFNIKSLAIAAAVSASIVFAMPVTSQAKQPNQPGSQSNLETKKSKDWWARHCRISNDVKCGYHSTLSSRRKNYTGHSIYRRHKSGVTIKTY
jgi:hypothetical protein